MSGLKGCVEEYLRGEITPDVIIEQVSDLLGVFDERNYHVYPCGAK
jgi:hypothetical protein